MRFEQSLKKEEGEGICSRCSVGKNIPAEETIRAKTLRQPGGVFEEQQKKPLDGME